MGSRNVGSLHLWQSADGSDTFLVLSDVGGAADRSKGKLEMLNGMEARWQNSQLSGVERRQESRKLPKGLQWSPSLQLRSQSPDKTMASSACMCTVALVWLLGSLVGGTTVR